MYEPRIVTSRILGSFHDAWFMKPYSPLAFSEVPEPKLLGDDWINDKIAPAVAMTQIPEALLHYLILLHGYYPNVDYWGFGFDFPEEGSVPWIKVTALTPKVVGGWGPAGRYHQGHVAPGQILRFVVKVENTGDTIRTSSGRGTEEVIACGDLQGLKYQEKKGPLRGIPIDWNVVLVACVSKKPPARIARRSGRML